MRCAEEKEKPELLAESPERRKRIAKDSGKTEQQVLYSFTQKLVQISDKKIQVVVVVVCSGEPACSADISNESEDEELDGSNGRRSEPCVH